MDNGTFEGETIGHQEVEIEIQTPETAEQLESEAQALREDAAARDERAAQLRRAQAMKLREEAEALEAKAKACRRKADEIDPPNDCLDDVVGFTYADAESQAASEGTATPRKAGKRAKKATKKVKDVAAKPKRGPGRPRKAAQKPFKKAAKRGPGRPPKNGARKAGKQLAGPSSEKPTPEQILKLLRANPATPGAHIAATGGWKPTDTMAILKMLEADGRVEREGEKRGTKWSAA